MGKLQVYILRQLLLSALLIMVALTCVVWLTRSLRFVELIVNQGLSLTTFVSFTLLLLPTFLAIIGPVALFIATLFIYNKMMHDREIVILGASGLGPGFIARPAIVLALALTALGYLNTLYLVPATFREFKDLQQAFRTDLSHLFVQEGVFNSITDGVTVFVREHSDRSRFRGIVVHDERNPDIPITIMAEQGEIVSGEDGPRVVMDKGLRQEVSQKDGRLTLFHFDRYTLDLAALQPGSVAREREPRERFLHELFSPADRNARNAQRLRMEGLSRLTTPLLYLCYALTALAVLLFGNFSRRGQTNRILVAVSLVAAIQIAFVSARNVGAVRPELEALIVLIPVAVIVLFTSVLFRSELTGMWRRYAPGALR